MECKFNIIDMKNVSQYQNIRIIASVCEQKLIKSTLKLHKKTIQINHTCGKIYKKIINTSSKDKTYLVAYNFLEEILEYRVGDLLSSKAEMKLTILHSWNDCS